MCPKVPLPNTKFILLYKDVQLASLTYTFNILEYIDVSLNESHLAPRKFVRELKSSKCSTHIAVRRKRLIRIRRSQM